MAQDPTKIVAGMLAQTNPLIARLLEREGGYVDHPSDRGGRTNFGISQRAYPDLDISNLTAQDAAGIYQRDYYDAIGADSLPESIREIAFDAAVNHGPSYAKQLIQQAGADPQQMLAMRKQKYEDIIANDPSQSVFRDGWMNRLNGLGEVLSPEEDFAQGVAELGGPVTPEQDFAQGVAAQGGEPMMGSMTLATSAADDYERALYDAANPEPATGMERVIGNVMSGLASSAPTGKYSGNSGFLGGMAQGAARASDVTRRRVQLKKAQMDLLRYRADQEYKRGRDTQQQRNADRTYGLSKDRFKMDEDKFSYQKGQDKQRFGLDLEKFNYTKDKDTAERAHKQALAEGFNGYSSASEYGNAANQMRDDAAAAIKPIQPVRDKFREVKRIYDKRKRRFDNWSGADDLQLVYGYMGSLDPKSIVRGEEYQQAQQVAGIPSQYLGMINSVLSGEGTLPKAAREQIFRNMNDNYALRKAEADSIRKDWSDRAEFQKLKPEHVIGSQGWDEPIKFYTKEQEERFRKMREEGIR